MFRVETYGDQSPRAVQLAVADLWETCRRSSAARNEDATLSRVDDGVSTTLIRPALPSHDVLRLRGCLQDAHTNRTSAVVLSEGQAGHRR
ncbi:hypothetical protein OG250_45650 [Streptomyces sp. NBC_00487]|uniref:hypothetical protein n=1 Tax=Streptomyces sp. NBC_00487 TaxID=2903656 RepID=UPI002E185AAB